MATSERRSRLAENDPNVNRDLARRNLVLGWALFGLFLVLFAGTVLVALIYLAVD